MDTVIKMFYSPSKAFGELKNAEKFPFLSLIVLLTVIVINTILMIPVSTKVAELTLLSTSMPISDEQMAYTMEFMHKIRYLTMIGSIFSYMFIIVVYSALIWVISKMAKCTLSFQKAFELIIHCYFALAIGGLVNTFILYYRGIENIDNIYEISFTGLNLLTSTESVGVIFYTFLTLINPFNVWLLALLTVGVAKLSDIKFSKAFIISFIFWAILIAFPVFTLYFSQTFLKSKGLF